jgi:hypothetical protein
MPLTPYRGFAPNQSQQFAAQAANDPVNSPLGKLKGNLTEMWNRGIDPMMVEQQYQAGLSQQGFKTDPRNMPSYGSAVPSMRQNLMKLPTTRAQY